MPPCRRAPASKDSVHQSHHYNRCTALIYLVHTELTFYEDGEDEEGGFDMRKEVEWEREKTQIPNSKSALERVRFGFRWLLRNRLRWIVAHITYACSLR